MAIAYCYHQPATANMIIAGPPSYSTTINTALLQAKLKFSCKMLSISPYCIHYSEQYYQTSAYCCHVIVFVKGSLESVLILPPASTKTILWSLCCSSAHAWIWWSTSVDGSGGVLRLLGLPAGACCWPPAPASALLTSIQRVFTLGHSSPPSASYTLPNISTIVTIPE